MTLYTDLIDAGIEVRSWQSDLYFPVTPESKEILLRYPKQSRSVFKSNADGQIMYECPFAFDPYWQTRGFK